MAPTFYYHRDLSPMMTGATNQTVWLNWTAATNATAATATTTTQVWEAWTYPLTTGLYDARSQTYARRLTPEEQAEQNRKSAERKREADEARVRARALLDEVLDRKQRRELAKHGYFHVETRDGQRRYRLMPGGPLLRVHGEDGRRWSYCIHPSGWWPPEDVVVAHKLLLEANEDEFLRIANASPA